jgi:hypothetical protein
VTVYSQHTTARIGSAKMVNHCMLNVCAGLKNWEGKGKSREEDKKDRRCHLAKFYGDCFSRLMRAYVMPGPDA